MRTRNIKKQIWLNRDEEKLLKEKSYKTGLTESELIRKMITDSIIREKPDEKFYEYIKELRAIGINLNQIAHKCNAIGIVDPTYQEEAKKWNEFIIEIKKKFLL